jgi:ABC-type dipeptide/oligopeptide/nickel transport system permease component
MIPGSPFVRAKLLKGISHRSCRCGHFERLIAAPTSAVFGVAIVTAHLL